MYYSYLTGGKERIYLACFAPPLLSSASGLKCCGVSAIDWFLYHLPLLIGPRGVVSACLNGQAEDEESHQSWVSVIKAEIEHLLSASQVMVYWK